eukprot:TRINITY_DN68722_c0_g1_i1.p1 TRINITY_DN68722_c0_g1~~TRINITY_DN68722_c0_g1_i1.p1  ORF type:complete len:274 (-),score=22.89 TRINITY_DN68722_c0_g1_i1:467-1288(-)
MSSASRIDRLVVAAFLLNVLLGMTYLVTIWFSSLRLVSFICCRLFLILMVSIYAYRLYQYNVFPALTEFFGSDPRPKITPSVVRDLVVSTVKSSPRIFSFVEGPYVPYSLVLLLVPTPIPILIFPQLISSVVCFAILALPKQRGGRGLQPFPIPSAVVQKLAPLTHESAVRTLTAQCARLEVLTGFMLPILVPWNILGIGLMYLYWSTFLRQRYAQAPAVRTAFAAIYAGALDIASRLPPAVGRHAHRAVSAFGDFLGSRAPPPAGPQHHHHE